MTWNADRKMLISEEKKVFSAQTYKQLKEKDSLLIGYGEMKENSLRYSQMLE